MVDVPMPGPDRISVYGDARYSEEALRAYAAQVEAATIERCARAAKEALLALSQGERASGDIAVHATQSAMGWPIRAIGQTQTQTESV